MSESQVFFQISRLICRSYNVNNRSTRASRVESASFTRLSGESGRPILRMRTALAHHTLQERRKSLYAHTNVRLSSIVSLRMRISISSRPHHPHSTCGKGRQLQVRLTSQHLLAPKGEDTTQVSIPQTSLQGY